MRGKLLGTIGLFAGMALVAAAAPAFTADNAALSVTVTAQPAAAACVMFDTSGTQVDFGTLPFSVSANSDVGLANGPTRPRFSNCGTARENLFIAGTPAHNVCSGSCTPHTWTLGGAEGECPALNGYQLWYYVDNHGIDLGGASLRTTNIPLLKAPNSGPPGNSYAPNEAHDLGLQIKMPCQASDGAGEPFSLGVTVTAAVP